MKQRRWQLASASFAILVISACGESTPSPPGFSPLTRFDFGRISVDTGEQSLTHVFTLTNETNAVLEVRDIRKTCGCVGAELAKDRLDPGESTSLALTLEVSSTGQTTHGATVLFSNGTTERFSLTAYGTLGLELVPILQTGYVGAESREVPLRLYLVDSDGQGENGAPAVLAPNGVSLHFQGWITLERQTQKKLRPTRQVGNAILSFASYEGEFPVQVRLRSAVGAECTVTIEALSNSPITAQYRRKHQAAR